MIRCIGDSHASFFSGTDDVQPIWPKKSNDINPIFRSYRIGPATAYNLSNKREIIDSVIQQEFDFRKDKLMFCFGEVDCRVHLVKQAQANNRTFEDVVDECIQKYWEVVFVYKKSLPIIIWNVIPTTNHPDVESPLSIEYNGSVEERKRITELFNSRLEKLTRENGIYFLNIYNSLLGENGRIKDEFLIDGLHLSSKAMKFVMEKKFEFCQE